MKSYRVVSVEPVRHAVVCVTFDDGLSGEVDLNRDIETNVLFAPLADRALFDRVSVATGGRAFGWKLDDIGHEIDLGADGVRIDIEAQKVHELAERFRSHRTAAE
jgi:hypothetical protein